MLMFQSFIKQKIKKKKNASVCLIFERGGSIQDISTIIHDGRRCSHVKNSCKIILDEKKLLIN